MLERHLLKDGLSGFKQLIKGTMPVAEAQAIGVFVVKNLSFGFPQRR
jgi:hypothetical protein